LIFSLTKPFAREVEQSHSEGDDEEDNEPLVEARDVVKAKALVSEGCLQAF
jgi:hypothetical protein